MLNTTINKNNDKHLKERLNRLLSKTHGFCPLQYQQPEKIFVHFH